VPLRLFGGLHYLVLAGRAPAYGELDEPWPVVRGILEEHRDWLRGFVASQPVQTNEVGRAWALLPGFLVAVEGWGGPVDLLELGPSGGLNLSWDRYRYRYARGPWGPEGSPIELAGEERREVPAEVLAREVAVRRRAGVDRSPVDVTDEHGALLLQAFVWADDPARLERVRRAIAVVREDPPVLTQGDFVELAPALLAERDPDALTIVFDSNSTEYLEDGRYAELERGIAAQAERGPLAWVSMEQPRAGERRPYVVEVTRWPGGGRTRLAEVHYHGSGLRWLA